MEENINTKSLFSTPILFLIFNRPEKTKIVFNQIKKIRPKYLYLAADGHRPNKEGEKELCNEARSIVNEINWPCELKTLFRENNLGCRDAVSSAINWFFENVEEGIIIEDDIYPDLSFFQFCSEQLEKYRFDFDVFHINGTNFMSDFSFNDESHFFSKFPIIWGWATWKRAWNYYDIDMKDYSSFKDQNLLHKMYLTKKQINYYKRSFERIYFKKKYDSWDGEWEYAVMKNNGLTITPTVNLTINIGTDANSTHLFLKDSKRDNIKLKPYNFNSKNPNKAFKFKYDNIIFENWHGKSTRKVFRLIRENGIINFIKYIVKNHV